MTVPLVAKCIALSPTIIPAAAASALLVMAGSTAYAYSKPQGEFRAWRAGLYGGLGALISMNVMGLLSFMIMGPNMFWLATRSVDTYAGIALFTAFQIHDTQNAIDEFNEGNYDHLQHVVEMFLNFKNLLVSLARLFIDEIIPIVSDYSNDDISDSSIDDISVD